MVRTSKAISSRGLGRKIRIGSVGDSRAMDMTEALVDEVVDGEDLFVQVVMDLLLAVA